MFRFFFLNFLQILLFSRIRKINNEASSVRQLADDDLKMKDR